MRAPPVARARLGQQHIRRRCVAVAAAAGDSRMLTLHLSDTTLSLPFDPVCAQASRRAICAGSFLLARVECTTLTGLA